MLNFHQKFPVYLNQLLTRNNKLNEILPKNVPYLYYFKPAEDHV